MTESDCPTGDPTCYCPLTDVIDVLGRKYAIPVVCAVDAHGRLRFGDLETHFPDASTSTLSARLDDLQAAGLVDRTQYDEIPPRVEYELTDDGRELADRLEPLVEWVADRE
ncbi:transcriptional regulator [halophilic archaeon]|nr:transcriptional regulator [halophilic archaeon]